MTSQLLMLTAVSDVTQLSINQSLCRQPWRHSCWCWQLSVMSHSCQSVIVCADSHGDVDSWARMTLKLCWSRAEQTATSTARWKTRRPARLATVTFQLDNTTFVHLLFCHIPSQHTHTISICNHPDDSVLPHIISNSTDVLQPFTRTRNASLFLKIHDTRQTSNWENMRSISLLYKSVTDFVLTLCRNLTFYRSFLNIYL